MVKGKLEAELYDTEKFEELEDDVENNLSKVVEIVRTVVCDMEAESNITAKDRELITGLNNNLNMKHAHVLKTQSPYVYPLFKVHKLSTMDIQAKKIPPIRLVHASKFGPLYRLEKWISPSLTTISRAYCEDEYLLDTDDLLSQIKKFNENLKLTPLEERKDLLLFTLDVEALYPSIKMT